MTAHAIDPSTSLPFTGERMVPHESDFATELFHWQRYLFFRPWYEDTKVVDAASGEGYGISYAANFSSEATGIEISDEAIAHSRSRYRKPKFVQGDVCEYDYSDAELVISFETIEHLAEPATFLNALASCKGDIVISTPNRIHHSPGNDLEDKPLNGFHTVEWTPSEFASLIEEHFPDRRVRFLSQQGTWPGTIHEGLDDNAHYVIAVIGERELPVWPRLGISIPTHNGSARCREAVVGMTRFYPGEVQFAIVDNGSMPEESAALDLLHDDFPFHVNVLHLAHNIGYGIGANTGLDYLWQQEWFDYFCVSNDDVTPAVDCLSQLVCAMKELEREGHRPGVIGPVTNNISGKQQVDIGSYRTYNEMIDLAEAWHTEHHSIGSQVQQLRGLFMLIHPDCLSDVGGFDPLFGIGNFEDDDHNLRCRMAGYTLWIAEGAFLHHAGSSTFAEIQVDYQANIQRNLQLICEKWGFADFNEFLTLEKAPDNVKLFIPLTSSIETSGYWLSLGNEAVDLICQASDVEFAAYIHNRLQGRGREARLAIIDALEKAA